MPKLALSDARARTVEAPSRGAERRSTKQRHQSVGSGARCGAREEARGPPAGNFSSEHRPATPR